MPSIKPYDDAHLATGGSPSYRPISGSDISSIDPYRQGVEILTENHLNAGIAKIYSGYLNHEIPQTTFGQTNVAIADENWYLEVDTFDVLSFMGYRIDTASTSSALHVYNGSFPRISSNGGAQPDVAMDGALEPFSIRSRASFFTIEAPVEAHDVKCAMVGGNEEKDGSSDVISDSLELTDRPNNSTFLDSSDTLGNVAIMGDYEPGVNVVEPWSDRQTSGGNFSSDNADDELSSILASMDPPQDEFIGQKKRFMSRGFCFDSQMGTDSLAFGGFTYASSSVSLPPIV